MLQQNGENSDREIDSDYRVVLEYNGGILEDGMEYEDRWVFERDGEDVGVTASLGLFYEGQILMNESVEYVLDGASEQTDPFLAKLMDIKESHPEKSPLNRNNDKYVRSSDSGSTQLSISGSALRRMQDDFGDDYWNVQWTGEAPRRYAELLGSDELPEADIDLQPEWLRQAPDEYVDQLNPRQIKMLNDNVVYIAEENNRNPLEVLEELVGGLDSGNPVSFHLTNYDDQAIINLTDPTPEKLREYIEIFDPDNIIRTDEEVTFDPGNFDDMVRDREEELYEVNNMLEGIEVPEETKINYSGLMASIPDLVDLDGRPFPKSKIDELVKVVNRHERVSK